jgi:hypothetical protein
MQILRPGLRLAICALVAITSKRVSGGIATAWALSPLSELRESIYMLRNWSFYFGESHRGFSCGGELFLIINGLRFRELNAIN